MGAAPGGRVSLVSFVWLEDVVVQGARCFRAMGYAGRWGCWRMSGYCATSIIS